MLLWLKTLFQQLFQNSCWNCIHFRIKWELGKIFDPKMIGWTPFSLLIFSSYYCIFFFFYWINFIHSFILMLATKSDNFLFAFLELPAAAHCTIELWPTLVFRLWCRKTFQKSSVFQSFHAQGSLRSSRSGSGHGITL